MDDAPGTMLNQLVNLEVRNKRIENVGHQAGFLMILRLGHQEMRIAPPLCSRMS